MRCMDNKNRLYNQQTAKHNRSLHQRIPAGGLKIVFFRNILQHEPQEEDQLDRGEVWIRIQMQNNNMVTLFHVIQYR